MTWPQVERRLTETRLLVVPTAGIEQHGNHLPLSVDTLRAEVLDRRVAETLDCVCAPVVRPGLPAHHMEFPGTITLDDGVRTVSENGVLGSPESATAEQGARLVDACVEYFAVERESGRGQSKIRDFEFSLKSSLAAFAASYTRRSSSMGVS